MAAAAQLTASAITHSRARAQDSSPGGLRSWREPGCGLPGKRWGRKGKLFRSSGWPTTTGPHVGTQDRRSLDLVVYGALSSGGAQCCDAALVSPLARSGHPQPCAAAVDGAVLRVAERRKRAAYPELARGGPQTLVVLGSEVGGGWNAQARSFVRDLVRLRAYRAAPAVRAGDCRLGAALVEHAFNCGAAGSRQYGLWAAGGLRGPAARQHPPPRRPKGPQPPALAALAKDREGAAAAGFSGGSGRSKETSPAGGKRPVKKKLNDSSV